jgi:hypothetical protein
MLSFNDFYLQENKLRKALAVGAMAASSAFGNFVDDWSKYYQTSNDPAKEARAAAVINANIPVPEDAKKAIDTAVYIFQGDKGKTAAQLADYLEKTGAVESGYRTKVQRGGGPARSYWQVEPETAMDLVKNSSPLFGPKFRSIFGEDALKIIQQWDKQQWSRALEESNELGAVMAAAKWLTTPW